MAISTRFTEFNPFDDRYRGLRQGGAEIRFVVETLSKKHGVDIRFNELPAGDYVEFRTQKSIVRVDRTALASMNPRELLDYVEGKLLPEPDRRFRQEYPGDVKAGKPKTGAEEWADKWLGAN